MALKLIAILTVQAVNKRYVSLREKVKFALPVQSAELNLLKEHKPYSC
jgi:hypothetical protein